MRTPFPTSLTAATTSQPTFTTDGPVLPAGGPYRNLQATPALIEAASRRGISPTHIICTGDVVASGGDGVIGGHAGEQTDIAYR